MKTWLVVVFLAAFALALVSAEPSGWGGYFQYANVPGWGQYEFGYNRGNHDHFTSRFEQGWGWKFKTKVRWGDKKGGYGEMYYDYQHAPKKGWGHGHHGHGHKHHHHGSGSQLASFSENVPTVLKPASGPSPLILSSNPEPIMSSIPPPQSHYSSRRMARVLQQPQQQPQMQPTQLVYRPQPRFSRAYRQQQQQQPMPVYYNPYPMRY